MSFEDGQVLAGRYRLQERIATGGMGEVWHAHDETLSRDVAIKVLRPDTADDEAFAERFRAEARHAGGLSHPNIGTVHDFGEDGGVAYLVMELLEGAPLSVIISEQAPMDPQRVSDILYQAALALQAAHDAGVVHRDVKPANIVVDAEGYAKLTDFGISRAVSEAPLTQTGEVLGTPHYLAPEQAQGQPAGPLSDVYALAVVGYEMLTGERPFAGDSMVTTALAHVSQPAPQLPETVPEPLRTTVMAGLAKDPSQRPASAAAFAEALRLQPGDLPEHLQAGAAAAVTPVIVVGTPVTLDPSATLPTSVLSAPVTPVTPTGLSTQSPRRVPSASEEQRRRRWMWPLAALVVGMAVILAIALTGRESAGDDLGPGSGLPATVTTPVATAASTTARSAATTSTTATGQPSEADEVSGPAGAVPVAEPRGNEAPADRPSGKGNNKGKRDDKK